MAEISDDALRELIEQLKSMVDRGIPVGSELKKVLDSHNKGLKTGSKSLDDIRKTLDRYNKEIDRGRLNAKNLTDSIQELQDSLEDLEDTVKREEVQKQINMLKSKATWATVTDQLKQGIAGSTKALTSAAFTGGKDLVNNLSGNASGFKVAGDIMQTGVDLMSHGAKGAADALTTVGSTMVAVAPVPQLKILGGALTVLGTIVGSVGAAMSELTKAGISFLVQEADKLSKTFQDATGAGAIFANGMTGFTDAAGAAGLTFDQLSSVVKQNSEVFAQSGLTVGGAVKQIGNVGKAIRDAKLDTGMLNLGFSFEEQAELTARVIADMRKIGMRGTDQQVAQATADYAKNLRVIADITGEDARKRTEEARQAALQYAFRAKVEERARELGDPGLWTRVVSGLAVLSESQRKAAIQSYVLNGAVTDVGANLMGLREPAQQFGKWIDSGGKDVKDGLRGFAEAGDRMTAKTDEIGRAVSMGAIAIGANADLAKQYGEIFDQSTKLNTKNLDKAISDAANQEKTSDGMTQMFTDIAKQSQEMRIQLQELVLSQGIPRLGEAVAKTLTVIQNALTSFGVGGPGPTFKAGEKGFDKQQATAANQMLSDKKIYESKEFKAWQEAQVAAGGFMSRFQTGIYGSLGVEAFKKASPESISAALKFAEETKKTTEEMPAYAKGGITSGPSIAGEAGPEAIVPLPNGRSIPVDMDLRPLVEALQDLLDVNKDNRDYLEKLFHASV